MRAGRTLCMILSVTALLPAWSGEKTLNRRAAVSEARGKTIVFADVSLSTGMTLNYAEQGRGKKNVLILLHG